jgi:hypothetical protein
MELFRRRQRQSAHCEFSVERLSQQAGAKTIAGDWTPQIVRSGWGFGQRMTMPWRDGQQYSVLA